MNDEIEIFGVKCSQVETETSVARWSGQMEEYPRMTVDILQLHSGWFYIRIEWFGNPRHNRTEISQYGATLDQAKQKVSKAFAGMTSGMKAISGRII